MALRVLLCILLVALLRILSIRGSSCSRSLPSYNDSKFTGGQFSTGGVQLLIPSWNFSCQAQGAIKKWFAHVTGNTSIADLLEFQIFRSDPNSEDLYHLVYHNTLEGNTVNGSMLTKVVDGLLIDLFLPVRDGYIVGVYLPPNTDFNINLLYDTDGDTDVYYWENVDNRTCNFSLCSGKIMRNINLFIGWEFMDSALNLVEDKVQQKLADYTNYCQWSSLQCNNTTDTLIPLLSSSISTSLSAISTGILPATMSNSMPSTRISPSSSSVLSTTKVMPSSVTTSTSAMPTPSNSSIFSSLSPALWGAFAVVLVLFVIVIILIVAISICCCMRHKPIVESSIVVQAGFDNPDYNGVISTGSVKKHPLQSTEMRSFHDMSPTQNNVSQQLPIITQTEASPPPPTPQFDDAHYYSAAGLQNSLEIHTKIDTQTHPTTPLSPPERNTKTKSRGFTSSSNSYLPPPPVLSNSGEDKKPFYSVLESNNEPNNSYLSSPESPTSNLHHYASPTTEVSHLSFPGPGGIYDMIDEDEQPDVPPTQDPEVVHGYDQVQICNKGPSQVQNSNSQNKVIYAYVPTAEQRKLLDWRYELPMDVGYNKLTFFEQQNKFWAPASTTSGLYEQLAVNKYREIPREKIEVLKVLGQGQFGSVHKGMWASPDGRHEVAIKMLKPDATEEDRLKLLQEAAIMGQFNHKNVVAVKGVVTLGDPIMLVLEYMPRGDLRSYLRSIKPKHGRWQPHPSLPKLLIKFCHDVALGLRYLAEKSFVHRDLAARNILLAQDLTCKIGDFGMARDLMQDEGNYYTSSGGVIPIKWTAPEALNFRKYSTDSDVWSYGMVLFEIWSLGHKPFNDLSNPIVIALINSKHCQAPPPGCPRPIYKLMVDCWHPEHSKRPPFTRIVTYLESPTDSLLGWNKEDNIRGKNAHILGAPLEESSDLYIDLQRVYQQSMLTSHNGRQRSKSNY